MRVWDVCLLIPLQIYQSCSNITRGKSQRNQNVFSTRSILTSSQRCDISKVVMEEARGDEKCSPFIHCMGESG